MNSNLLIAGPCAAESERQVLDIASELALIGVKHFRAGVWKPRTKPGMFEGAGDRALDWLARVKRLYGMEVYTEVATPAHLAAAAAAGIDGVWLGARTSANPFAVQQIADAFGALEPEQRKAMTVMVKNPVNPDLDLWIGAIERMRLAGASKIIAVHRGFSFYGSKLYRNEPCWAIPIELRRRMPDVPVICDPSHIGGSRSLVAPLAMQAMDMGFNGLIVEVHSKPDSALSDARQQITPSRLADLLAALNSRKKGGHDACLDALRTEIDRVDDSILALLTRRMEIARQIGALKRQHGLSVVQPHRYNSLMERYAANAADMGLSADFVRKILATIHEESVRCQINDNLTPDK